MAVRTSLAVAQSGRPPGAALEEEPALSILGAFSVSIVATLATTPIAIYHFDRAAAYSLLANLLAEPVVAFVVMPAAAVAVIVMPVWTRICASASDGLGRARDERNCPLGFRIAGRNRDGSDLAYCKRASRSWALEDYGSRCGGSVGVGWVWRRLPLPCLLSSQAGRRTC